MNAAPCYSEARTYFGARARLLRFRDFADSRGKLAPLPFDGLPFVPQRSFFVTHVPAGTVRGRHGHRTGNQLLFCLCGRIEVSMRAGGEEAKVNLADDSCGLLIGPGIWAQQTYLTEHAVLLVLASDIYDPASYFTDAGGAS